MGARFEHSRETQASRHVVVSREAGSMAAPPAQTHDEEGDGLR